MELALYLVEHTFLTFRKELRDQGIAHLPAMTGQANFMKPRRIKPTGFLALAGAHMQDRKKRALMGDAWDDWQSRTSYWPRFGKMVQAGAIAWIGGLLIWLGATYGHIHANGMPAGIWRWVG